MIEKGRGLKNLFDSVLLVCEKREKEETSQKKDRVRVISEGGLPNRMALFRFEKRKGIINEKRERTLATNPHREE